MENLGLGFELMAVGIVTVFVILLIVIWGGELLIRTVNKIAPAETEKLHPEPAQPAAVDVQTMAILQQVVNQVTGGKGRVESARKV